jgi:hypothetical protein
MKTIKIIIAIWVMAAVIAGVFGNVTIAGELGSTTAGFLKVGVGARALGMGGAFTSIADNPSAVYWNPAGLRRMEMSQAEFSHQSWYQDVNIENLQIAFPGRKVSFGAGLTYLSFGQIQSFDEFGEPGDELSMYNMAFTLSAAADVTENVAIGISAKYIEQSFDILKGTAFAGDIGLMANYGGIQVGVAAVNIGTKVKYISVEEKLPAAARLGFSFRQFDNKALISVEAYSPFDGQLSLHQGLEMSLYEHFHARSGLIYRTGTLSDVNALSYNLGLGLGYGSGKFDYTFIPSDYYGSDAVHSFTISLSW